MGTRGVVGVAPGSAATRDREEGLPEDLMNPISVLIVAPSPFQLSLMSDLMAANGVRTRRARGIDQAIAAARQDPPTLVLLDLEFGARESSRLARELARHEETGDVAVLAVAARDEREAAAQLVAKLDGPALEKPIDCTEFPRTVLREIRRQTTTSGRSALV